MKTAGSSKITQIAFDKDLNGIDSTLKIMENRQRTSIHQSNNQFHFILKMVSVAKVHAVKRVCVRRMKQNAV
jgi:hypothetical protein